MDRNTVTGLLLIFALIIGYQWLTMPSKADLEREKRTQDSIAIAKKNAALPTTPNGTPDTTRNKTSTAQHKAADTAAVRNGMYGAFSHAAAGNDETITLENDVLRAEFSTRGGVIKRVTLKDYKKYVPSTSKKGEFTKAPVTLLDDPNNEFGYVLHPLGGQPVSTAKLYFAHTQTANSITFRLEAGEGKAIEQTYTLAPKSYTLGYDVQFKDVGNLLTKDKVTLNWVDRLNPLEKSASYERTMSTVNYRQVDDKPTYLSQTGDDTKSLTDKKMQWVAHTQQFFTAAIIAEKPFDAAIVTTAKPADATAPELKTVSSVLTLPYKGGSDETFKMRFYTGPNDYDRLKAENARLEEVVPFGWSIFGLINRWLIRPIFLFLSSFIGSAGIVILVLTLVIKLFVYPLTYQMIYSQSKMGVLKPEIAKLKDKFGSDTQGLQAEQMKLNREFGVNPLGGCLPMLAQLPIWFALYRFFPAALEFRQQSFLWADDLSSYDSIYNIGFNIPSYGDHISLFAILWAVTTLAYTYYNSKDMDFSANPAMAYMQYITPVIFLVFFNSFASGLSCYLVFSNLLNITQTLVTKRYFINHVKLATEMHAKRDTPKKKTRFQKLLDDSMQQQQAKAGKK